MIRLRKKSKKVEEIENRETDYSEFNPPKIPYRKLAVTFAVPVAAAIVPYLLSPQYMTWAGSLCVGFALLSIFLFVLWFTTHFQLYQEAYRRQILKYEIEGLKKSVDELKELTRKLAEEKELSSNEVDKQPQYKPTSKESYNSKR